MTIPGLAFFYGGLVRRKNVLSVLMQCFIIACVISLQWVLFGYSLAFGPDTGLGIIGSLEWAGLNFVGGQPNADYAATIPHQVFMIFQAMFAIITPALIIGAFAERMKFSAFLIFSVLWATFVYDPLAHWVWGTGGWLRNLGALGANELAANAFITTHIAAAAAGLTWALIEWQHHGAPTILGVATGAVAGLVAITPACGFVNPMNAIFIGILVSLFCYITVVVIKARLGYDDSLDAFGVHGVGGIWGTLATGLFAEKAVNSAGADGLFFGNPKQFLVQCFLVIVVPLFAAAMTWIIFKAVDALVGMRVEKRDEIVGLDLTQQSESAYTVVE